MNLKGGGEEGDGDADGDGDGDGVDDCVVFSPQKLRDREKDARNKRNTGLKVCKMW